ncbi:MAG: hypothetical protein COU09_00015 [Candidatus Harrisonbacteria bacterium CG10_big_fil_rev_8_21_14_0_10_44_23]|uniref:Uncharacterized protein n=1 Tax=Candidatus Harrisonbacteria bacterium CG10_big_fil_rev_8_21_14_0_10_44_23 TaxID=1974585 RepID=A0A2H0UR25_9BACT|nr:MAG: hypothetical protein COU09_00015 [Candidatus Harrisonbacteria bacterium CG10_big_fil_rev_8_21_14_0_10_44_23]
MRLIILAFARRSPGDGFSVAERSRARDGGVYSSSFGPTALTGTNSSLAFCLIFGSSSSSSSCSSSSPSTSSSASSVSSRSFGNTTSKLSSSTSSFRLKMLNGILREALRVMSRDVSIKAISKMMAAL